MIKRIFEYELFFISSFSVKKLVSNAIFTYNALKIAWDFESS